MKLAGRPALVVAYAAAKKNPSRTHLREAKHVCMCSGSPANRCVALGASSFVAPNFYTTDEETERTIAEIDLIVRSSN
jgi:hypothetical protein